ncbi:MAG: 4'-phosphopantetheinyl transferase superfamily protein [Candidatus Anammoximicrobium sp.]|nr:4'-phosphopantetheinyl transferase superfamily protein [Candidatus Anammoximicrobium sp.]
MTFPIRSVVEQRSAVEPGEGDEVSTQFVPPTQDLTLLPGQVHVWRASLARHRSHLAELQLLLSAAERARADRFHFAADRDRFTAAHGLLRTLLARYLPESPAQILFAQSSFGKPALELSAGDEDLRFNLSHSQGLVLYAVARGREVGVDVEQIRTMPDCEQIAEQFFSPSERLEWASLSEECRLTGFFGIWTLKEAYVKARGLGLSVPLADFSVSLQPDAAGNCLTSPEAGLESAGWFLRRLMPGSGYAGAVAVEGRDGELACWELLVGA